MPDGGILGFHCCHKYVHNNGTAYQRMPFALKGIDVAIFSVFSDLGLSVLVRPMILLEDEEYYDGEEKKDPEGPRIGQFSGIEGWDMEREDPQAQILDEEWKHQKFGPDDITWLNWQCHEEKSAAYIAYGNEAALRWFYTSVVILITVPKPSKRATGNKASFGMNFMNIERNHR